MYVYTYIYIERERDIYIYIYISFPSVSLLLSKRRLFAAFGIQAELHCHFPHPSSRPKCLCVCIHHMCICMYIYIYIYTHINTNIDNATNHEPCVHIPWLQEPFCSSCPRVKEISAIASSTVSALRTRKFGCSRNSQTSQPVRCRQSAPKQMGARAHRERLRLHRPMGLRAPTACGASSDHAPPSPPGARLCKTCKRSCGAHAPLIKKVASAHRSRGRDAEHP